MNLEATGEQLKDIGMMKVAVNNKSWRDRALANIRALPVNWEGTGEDIRLNVVTEQPKHPNAWGSLISAAVRDELIFPTGDYTAMKAKGSHARKTPVYGRL